MAAFGAAGSRRRVRAPAYAPGSSSPAAAALLVALVPLSRRQIMTWRNGTTLFTHALAVTDGNFMAHNNLGSELERAGRWTEAVAHYEASRDIRPGVAPVHYNLGVAYVRLARPDEAEAEFEQAVELLPDYPRALVNLGLLLSQRGADAEGVRHLARAWELDPQLVPAGQGLAWVLATSQDASVRDGARAVEVAEASLEQSEVESTALLEVLAASYAEADRYPQALRAQRAAARAAPPAAEMQVNERLRLYEAGQPFRKSP